MTTDFNALLWDSLSYLGVKKLADGKFTFQQSDVQDGVEFVIFDLIAIMSQPQIARYVADLIPGNADMADVVIRSISIQLYKVLWAMLQGKRFELQRSVFEFVKILIALGISDQLQGMLPISPQ